MALVAHLVERDILAGESGTNTIAGIEAMIICIDDSADNTGAKIQARARTVLVAAGYEMPIGYFTSNRLLSIWDAAGDYTVFNGVKESEFIAS